jgi:homoserine kinase
MRVCVSVPATAANLGPGFDCLGMALGLYHRVSVREVAGEGVEIRASGEGARNLPLDEENLIYRAIRKTLDLVGYKPRRLILESSNDIPLAAGLGSSAAAYTAGLAAGTLLSGQRLDVDQLIRLGCEQEGHADNVAPCVLGGFTTLTGGVPTEEVQYLRLDPPSGLTAQIAIPDFSLPTAQARSVLPETVAFQDAVFNQSRVGLLTAAMALGRTDMLAWAMQDRLHQPFRARLVPGLADVMSAAVAAGAAGAVLSGAGPTVLALSTESNVSVIGMRMAESWKRHGIDARLMTLAVDRRGLLADRRGDGDG